MMNFMDKNAIVYDHLYKLIGREMLKNPLIMRPVVKAKTLSSLKFEKMKEMGMKKLIFDRGYTLTKQF
mgnify:CR=1 FL=1